MDIYLVDVGDVPPEKYRALRRMIAAVALLLLLGLAAHYGWFAGLAFLAAFAVGVAFASLNVLEEAAARRDKRAALSAQEANDGE